MTTRTSNTIPALLLTLIGIAASPADAQTTQTQQPLAQGDCAPGNTQPDAGDSGNLTQKMDRCNGVLTAPSVGDGDIVEPTPQTGSGRVIDPESLPPNSNPSNGSGG